MNLRDGDNNNWSIKYVCLSSVSRRGLTARYSGLQLSEGRSGGEGQGSLEDLKLKKKKKENKSTKSSGTS